ncbi:MAG: LysM peptidoglycan-binding domain-containing protein [Acidiferrobacterales bacterium]
MPTPTNTPLPQGIYFEYAPAKLSSLHPYQHSYLVYRDGMGNAEVIRGGANWLGFASEVELQIGVPLRDSKDQYLPGQTPVDRHSTQLELGSRNPAAVWEQAKQAARQIDPDIDYDLYPDSSKLPEVILGDGGPIQNSNSITGTVLDAIGVDWRDALPDSLPAALVPGIETDLFSPDVDKGVWDEFVDDVANTFDSFVDTWAHGDDGRDPFFIDGYRYNPEDGEWYSAPPAPDYGQFSWQGKAPPEIQVKLAAERQLRMEEAQSQDERQSLLDNESTYPNPHLTENNDPSAMPTIPEATSSTPGAPNSPEWQAGADIDTTVRGNPHDNIVTYAVQPGESLWVIAEKTGVPFDQVLAANQHLEDPDLIFPGQKVNIPATFVDSDGFINGV